MGHLYEDIADHVATLAATGLLVAGERAPSLRSICEQHGVSLSTAIQAYRVLEDRGVLEARPRSGYYLANARSAALDAPRTSRASPRATDVAVSGLVLELLAHAADPKLAPLGCAIPSPEILARGKLEPFLGRVLRRAGAEHNVYTAPQGNARLRQEIARRSSLSGHAVTARDIVITNGCTEALSLALAALCKPGDIVAVESPTYFGLLHTLESLNLKALEVPTHADDGIDVSALGKALATQPVAACLLGSSFNNPLGSLMPEEKKRALLALLARHHVPLIEDDTYGDIYFGPQRPRPFSAYDQQGNTIYCSSFSKTIAPGWRIGWMVPGRHMQEVLDRKFAGTLCGPALSQAAFAEYLQSGGYDRHLRRIRNEFAQGLRRMTDVIAKEFPPGTRVSRPNGGFVLWVELDRRARTRDLLQSALKRGICFAPGEVFSAQGHYAHCLRISCGYGWSPEVEKALRTLAHLTHRHLQDVSGNRVSGTGVRPSSLPASSRT